MATETQNWAQIRLLETEIEKGQYLGEEGTGYGFIGSDDCPQEGDLSKRMHGYYQGSERIVHARMAPGCELAETKSGAYALFQDDGPGMDANDAIAAGLVVIE